MANSIYKINKGINTAIEFRGLKAQYIWYLGAVVLILMILFATLYLLGINQYLCIAIAGILGLISIKKIYGMSKTYGVHGLSKVMAKKLMPEVIKTKSRLLFMKKSKC